MTRSGDSAPVLLLDRFADAAAPGQVVDRRSPEGVQRQGADVEGRISIDGQALRIQPLLTPGWGRASLAYGPYQRQAGLAFAALILNGHNSSQVGGLEQSLFRRLGRWIKGSGAVSPLQRMWNLPWNGHRTIAIRQLWRWWQISRQERNGSLPRLDENLALGWFSSQSPADPLQSGSGFVVHAHGAENGELWTLAGGQGLPRVRGLQNIPILYVVILRQRGAALYACSLPGARGLGDYPQLRPLAIDPQGQEPELYAGVHQSVLGQIGFRVDTRLYAAAVARLAQYNQWYGTAQAADRLGGAGDLDGMAEIGGEWQSLDGRFKRTASGTVPQAAGENQVALMTAQPSGLMHIRFECTDEVNQVSFDFRRQDAANGWRLKLTPGQAWLGMQQDGRWETLAQADAPLLQGEHSFQVLDDGQMFCLALDAQLLFERWFEDERLAAACGLGLGASGAADRLRFWDFEAHARSIPMPAALDLGFPPVPHGEERVLQTDFSGPAGDLEGQSLGSDRRQWQRTAGQGRIARNGEGVAVVQASLAQPNPGRTLYTYPWDHPELADLEVTITPPGEGRGQGHRGRGGLVFWQDAQHYLILSTWLDDIYDGSSISSFFQVGGFEELYDAVWTNVGRRISWGRTYRLRVAFDGLVYQASVNDEPVLYRSLADVYPHVQRLAIRRVGIVANWEWGDDTGSQFHQLTAFR